VVADRDWVGEDSVDMHWGRRRGNVVSGLEVIDVSDYLLQDSQELSRARVQSGQDTRYPKCVTEYLKRYGSVACVDSRVSRVTWILVMPDPGARHGSAIGV